MNKNKNKILFFHNTLSWYRIDLFLCMQTLMNIKFIFTRDNIVNKIYNLNSAEYSYEDLNCAYIPKRRHFLEIFKVLIKEDYDIIVLPPMDSIGEMLDALIILILGKVKKKKISYFWEKWEFEKQELSFKKKLKKNICKKYLKFIFKYIDTFIAPGENTRRYFEAMGVNSKQIFIAPDSSVVKDKNIYFNLREKYNIKDNDVIILFYGRIVELKGIEYLLKSFKILENEFENLKLLICGDGEYKEKCEQFVLHNNIKNIYFLGKIPTKLRATFFSQIDIFTLPSIEINGQVEAWGLTINEVMDFGKPIIVSNAVGAYRDLVLNEENGYIVEQKNSFDLYLALKKLCLDSNKRIVMGKNSRNIIKNYTYEKMAKGFKDAFFIKERCRCFE
ncbi:glycosyltransferase family 4 protein [Clostridium perfringens]|nr:glycosyltransferase family 4 protein [Clostridium perfringens]